MKFTRSFDTTRLARLRKGFQYPQRIQDPFDGAVRYVRIGRVPELGNVSSDGSQIILGVAGEFNGGQISS